MLEQPLSQFQRSLDAPGKLILEVHHPRLSAAQRVEVPTPFAVIGRSRTADVPLKGSDVSYRHTYIQPIMGRVFCADLGSNRGTRWGKKRRKAGWLSSETAMNIGPYSIKLVEDPSHATPDAEDVYLSIDPLQPQPGELADFPRYTLQISDGKSEPTSFRIDRLITFVGRSSDCAIRLADESVSRVHCSLVLTSTGLWAVDLLGKSGIVINGHPQRYAELEHGDKLAIGCYTIQVQLVDSTEDLYEEKAPTPPLPDTALYGAAAPAEPADPVVQTSVKPKAHEWLGKLFEIVVEDDTLVVLPTLHAGTFRYIQLHNEANALQRKFDELGVHNLVIDLQKMTYLGTEAIVALIKLARKATDVQGLAVFCGLSTVLEEILTDMGILKLWPCFPNREEALEAVQKWDK